MKSNSILFGTPLLKAQNDTICWKFGAAMAPLPPGATPLGRHFIG